MMEFNDIWAAVIRLAVKQARLIENDQEALEVKSLYKEWNKQIGNMLNAGEYVQHEGQLFKVLTPHVAMEAWIPGVGTESLFMLVVKDHDGSLEDPIPFNHNMELVNGKYYIQNDVLYLCVRDSGIAIHADLKDLVGNYVNVVEGEKDEPAAEPDGSKENPFIFEAGMKLEVGMFYKQNDILYECVIASGGPIYHNLDALVGLYVEVDNSNYI